MKRHFFLSLFALAFIFSACSKENVDAGAEKPQVELTSDILINGPDANEILQNIDLVRYNMDLIARAMVGLSQDEGFAERAAQPLRNSEKAGNFAFPLGELLMTNGTDINQEYLTIMENSLSTLGGTSTEVANLKDIVLDFLVSGEKVYPKVTISIIGARQAADPEDHYLIDIRPQYIALSQSYSPGLLPAWEITAGVGSPATVEPSSIYEANVWYIGVANSGPFGSGSGLAFKLLAQGEECSCTVAMSGGCIEEASGGTMKILCGHTNTNCDCPGDCTGAEQE